eukprot:scaffold4002_cov123-Isochrysis_galbana.AAC.10
MSLFRRGAQHFNETRKKYARPTSQVAAMMTCSSFLLDTPEIAAALAAGIYNLGGILIYLSADQGGFDLRQIIRKVDAVTGTKIAASLEQLDPRIGNVGVAIAVNELLEPVRLPLAILMAVRIGSWRK